MGAFYVPFFYRFSTCLFAHPAAEPEKNNAVHIVLRQNGKP
jgi:hypothetical protein